MARVGGALIAALAGPGILGAGWGASPTPGAAYPSLRGVPPEVDVGFACDR
jgi:hypothetical protein